MAKRMKEKNERNSSKLIFNIFIVLVFLALLGGVFYLSPNYIREDYDGKTKVLINNNNVTLKMKNDVYIDENNNVFLSLADVRNYFDKYIEYDKENGSIVTTSEINIAKMSTKDNKITINGQEEELNSSAIEKNETIYLPFSEISEKVYDVDLEYIKDTKTDHFRAYVHGNDQADGCSHDRAPAPRENAPIRQDGWHRWRSAAERNYKAAAPH